MPPIIVFISGYRDFEYARQAMSMGVRFYILKPVKYEELVQTFTTIRMELDHKYQISEDFPGDSEQDRFVANVRAYVDGNLKSASLKGLANQLYMNSCYVSQLYKEKTGQRSSFSYRHWRGRQLYNGQRDYHNTDKRCKRIHWTE